MELEDSLAAVAALVLHLLFLAHKSNMLAVAAVETLMAVQLV
jgi:hypothetical protein